MNKESFWILFDDFFLLYTLCFLPIFAIFFLFYIKTKCKLNNFIFFHPFFFHYTFNYAFACTAVLFLFILNEVSFNLMIYFFLAQACFLGGFFLFSRTAKCKLQDYTDFYFVVSYKYSLILFLCSIIITYIFFNFGIFHSSRWEVYKAIAGMGIIGRILESSKKFIIFYQVYSYTKNKKIKITDSLIVILLICNGIISGSKSGVLEIVLFAYISYLFIIASCKDVKDIRSIKYSRSIKNKFTLLFVIAIIGSFVTVYIHQSYVYNREINPIQHVLKRFVMSGDLQIMSYPNNVLNYLKSDTSLLQIIFLDVKFIFRLIGVYFADIALGAKVMYYHYPYLEDVANIGPASTFETFFYYHFDHNIGWLLSFLTGVIIGYLNQMPIYKIKFELNALLFKASLAYLSYTILYNPQIALGKILFFIAYYYLVVFASKITVKI